MQKYGGIRIFAIYSNNNCLKKLFSIKFYLNLRPEMVPISGVKKRGLFILRPFFPSAFIFLGHFFHRPLFSLAFFSPAIFSRYPKFIQTKILFAFWSAIIGLRVHRASGAVLPHLPQLLT